MVQYSEKKNSCLETEELCTINISPLVTSPFSLQWSPDNQISLITEKGVHIFELKPSPMSSNSTIKFARSFIYPPDILPTFTFVEKVQSLIWNLDHQDLYLMLMEETLTPRIKDVNDTVLSVAKKSIEKIAWSPKNLIFSNHSILAILTKAGAVNLLHKVSDEWYSIYDVSSLRVKNLESSVTATLEQCKVSDYAKLTQSLRQVQACSMTWSELFEVKKTFFAYFCVAYRSGDISILKVPRISNLDEIQLLLVNSINLNIPEKITVLHWISLTRDNHLLIIGYYTGQLCGVNLTCRDDNVEVTSTITYFDSDCIAIDYIDIISQNESEIRFFVVKGIFLLSICIDSKRKLKSMQHLQIEGFRITGIIPIHDQQLLITTQDCRTIIVDTQSDTLNSFNIKNYLPQLHVQYLGLAHSPNKAMVIIVTSPTMTYDHLIVREPSVMLVFALKELSNPLSIIKNSTSLSNVWDCLEVLRLKAVKADDPKTIFGSMPEKFSLSLYDLQLSMWMAIMINVCTTKKSISKIDQISENNIKKLMSLVFMHSACTYLKSLIRKKELSTDETLAITLLRNYIDIYVKNEKNENIVQQHAREVLKAVAAYPNETEKCYLCSESIDELWKSSSCPNGHKLSRCSMTLLQVQWEYRVCPLCDRIFHPCLEAVYEELRCQYCDIPLLHNLHGLNLEPYGKNLSQLRSNADEASKEVDDLDEQIFIHKEEDKVKYL